MIWVPPLVLNLRPVFGSLWVENFHIRRLSPHPLAFDLHTLLAMTYLIMKDTTHLDLGRLGGVSVQDDGTILEVLGGYI